MLFKVLSTKIPCSMLNMLNNMIVIAIFTARGFVRVVLSLASELSAFEKLAFLLARNLYQWKVKSSEEHLKYHGLANCFTSLSILL